MNGTCPKDTLDQFVNDVLGIKLGLPIDLDIHLVQTHSNADIIKRAQELAIEWVVQDILTNSDIRVEDTACIEPTGKPGCGERLEIDCITVLRQRIAYPVQRRSYEGLQLEMNQ